MINTAKGKVESSGGGNNDRGGIADSGGAIGGVGSSSAGLRTDPAGGQQQQQQQQHNNNGQGQMDLDWFTGNLCHSFAFSNTISDDNSGVAKDPSQPTKPSSPEDQFDQNACGMADSTSDVMDQYERERKREQKRRPKPKDGTKLLCMICGDRALGYNFDAITCESCKAFFRRNALKTKMFTCSFEGNCKLDPHTRKFCSGCRLRKCFEAGMKKEWILSDDQLAKRKKRSGSSAYSSSPTQSGGSPNSSPYQTTLPQSNMPPQMGHTFTSPTSYTEISTTHYASDETDSHNSSQSQSAPGVLNFSEFFKVEKNEDDFPIPLREDIKLEIANLEKEYKAVFEESYSMDQAKKLTDKPLSANELFNMTDVFIRRLIKFVKHIPEFRQLKQEDQIHLLKGGIMEIMVLRSAMGFDISMQKWRVKQQEQNQGTERGLDPKMIQQALGQSVYAEHVKFVTSLNQLTKCNKTVMTLLFVIELFSSDRPNVLNKQSVSSAQEKFSMWLRAFLESIMTVGEAKILYPKLLVKLLDVRNLGESSSKLASHLDITKLEPLLIEVFSLQK